MWVLFDNPAYLKVRHVTSLADVRLKELYCATKPVYFSSQLFFSMNFAWVPQQIVYTIKNEPAFLLPIVTPLELEKKVHKLERSLIQFDVLKWLYDNRIKGSNFVCKFIKTFPVMQFDVCLLIII